MVCKPCRPKDEEPGFHPDLEFSDVVFDKSMPTGKTWHIYTKVWNNSFVFGDKGRVCIYDGDKVIAQSEQFKLAPDKEIVKSFTGVMPEGNLVLKASLVKELLGFTRCEDGFTINIVNGPADYVDPSDVPIEKEESLAEWLEDNLVLVLTLVLVIIALLKFG